MLLYFEILFAIVLLYNSFKSFVKKRFMFFLFSIFTLFYVIIRQILLLSDNYVKFSILNTNINEFNIQSIMYVFIFTVISYVVVSYIYFNTSNKYNRNIKYSEYSSVELPKVVMGLISVLVIIFVNPMFGLPFIVYLLIYYIYKYGFNIITLLFLIIVFYLFTFSIDRRDYLFLLLSLIFIYFSKIDKISILKVILIGCISMSILIYLLIAFRTDGLFEFTAVVNRINDIPFIFIFEIEADFPIVTDDLINLFDLLLIQNKIDFLYGIEFIKPIYSIIPREIWDTKPISIASLFAIITNPEWYYSTGGSLPLTIYGEVFWNFGYLSFIIFIIIGYVMKKLDKGIEYNILHNNPNISIYIVCISLSFHLLRGPVDNFWMLYLFLFIFIFMEQLLRNIIKSNIKGEIKNV